MSFRERHCPLCGAAGHHVLLDLKPDAFCSTNWTYAADAAAILRLEDSPRFPIVSCDSCGFVYSRLLPDSEFFSALYDRVIDRDLCVEGSEHRASYARRCRYVADLIEIAADGGRALDFGSGAGITLRILRACGVDAVGFDPSGMRRDYSSEHSLDVVADLDELAGRGPFAIVVLDNVLEHLPDPVATMIRIASFCTPDAVAYVSVPSYEPAMLGAQIAAHREGRPLDMTVNPWEHLNYFSLRTLDRTLARGGFAPILPASPPDIGLRRELASGARIKNAAASALRLASWAARGRGVESAERRFYRRA